MKLSRLYWIRLFVTAILLISVGWRAEWVVRIPLFWILISMEIAYFRTRAMYVFLFKHALTGNPHTQKNREQNG